MRTIKYNRNLIVADDLFDIALQIFDLKKYIWKSNNPQIKNFGSGLDDSEIKTEIESN